jgi:hypothetical protein
LKKRTRARKLGESVHWFWISETCAVAHGQKLGTLVVCRIKYVYTEAVLSKPVTHKFPTKVCISVVRYLMWV